MMLKTLEQRTLACDYDVCLVPQCRMGASVVSQPCDRVTV